MQVVRLRDFKLFESLFGPFDLRTVTAWSQSSLFAHSEIFALGKSMRSLDVKGCGCLMKLATCPVRHHPENSTMWTRKGTAQQGKGSNLLHSKERTGGSKRTLTAATSAVADRRAHGDESSFS